MAEATTVTVTSIDATTEATVTVDQLDFTLPLADDGSIGGGDAYDTARTVVVIMG